MFVGGFKRRIEAEDDADDDRGAEGDSEDLPGDVRVERGN